MGWFKDLINKIRGNGNKELPPGMESPAGQFNSVPDGMSKYEVNVGPGGQSAKAKQIEELIAFCANGNNPNSQINYQELTETEKRICYAIGIDLHAGNITQQDIDRAGGNEKLVGAWAKNAEDTAEQYGYMRSQGANFVGRTADAVKLVEAQQAEKNAILAKQLDSSARRAQLTLFYNVSQGLTESPQWPHVNADLVLRIAEQRSGRKLDGKDPNTELDIAAALRLAGDLKANRITQKEIDSVGYPADVMHRMELDAIDEAASYNRTDRNGYHYEPKNMLPSSTREVVETMQKENAKIGKQVDTRGQYK